MRRPTRRWLAYTSDESGRTHVYVSPFPNTRQGRHTVSTAEGFAPLWARDGSEGFYKTSTGELVAVRLAPGESFRVEEREVLFALTSLQEWRGANRYDVSPDGRRFLIIRIGAT